MLTPKQVAQQLEVTDQTVRKVARKLFGKANGGWKFTTDQVELIKQHLGTKKAAAAPLLATPQIDTSALTIQRLTEFANNWLQKTYGIGLKVPIEIRSSLKRALGYFQHKQSKKEPIKIALAARLFTHYDEDVVYDVLKHELVHYALYMLDKPHTDGHPYFESELKRLEVSPTHTYQAKGFYHIYRCSSCNRVTSHRARRITKLENYRSRCCMAELKYDGYQEVK